MLNFVRQALETSKATQKSFFSQILEILKLRFSHNRLGPSEYYLYRLYDDSSYSFIQKAEFAGWRYSQYLDQRFNDDRWRIFANDKHVFYSMMEAHGLAYPHVVALFDQNKKAALKQSRLLDSIQAARNFLQDPAIYPLFFKPVSGTYGRGAFSAISYDRETDAIRMGNGESIPLDNVLEMFQEKWARGYIMQKLLEPHPEVAALVGKRLSSLRIIVLLTSDGPAIFRAVWKLPTGRNMSDNFMHGETGNLIADVNLSTGLIGHAVTGVGANLRRVENHPDTGNPLSNSRVPLWEETRKLVTAGASLFPGLRMQHWDVALCPDGPVALEVNVEGSLDLHQLAGSKGIRDETMRRLTDGQ